jgi:hypothetical protein
MVLTTYVLNTAMRFNITLAFVDGAQRYRRITYTVANQGKTRFFCGQMRNKWIKKPCWL